MEYSLIKLLLGYYQFQMARGYEYVSSVLLPYS